MKVPLQEAVKRAFRAKSDSKPALAAGMVDRDLRR